MNEVTCLNSIIQKLKMINYQADIWKYSHTSMTDLPDAALQMTNTLSLNQSGPVFQSSEGSAWDSDWTHHPWWVFLLHFVDTGDIAPSLNTNKMIALLYINIIVEFPLERHLYEWN